MMINHIFMSFSAVQIYEPDIFRVQVYSSPSTGILQIHNLVWVSSQLDHSVVEHCTDIAEVMGSNPIQVWIFFQA